MTSRYDPQRHHRATLRLRAFNYEQAGAYFVTICTFGRECSLAVIDGAGVTTLTAAGRIVQHVWDGLPRRFSHVETDELVIMPNHVHGIVWLGSSNRLPHGRSAAGPTGTIGGSLGAVVQQLKSLSTQRINRARKAPGAPVWQRNYYEHVIRNEGDLRRVRQYIVENPLRWADDENHPTRWSAPAEEDHEAQRVATRSG